MKVFLALQTIPNRKYFPPDETQYFSPVFARRQWDIYSGQVFRGAASGKIKTHKSMGGSVIIESERSYSFPNGSGKILSVDTFAGDRRFSPIVVLSSFIRVEYFFLSLFGSNVLYSVDSWLYGFEMIKTLITSAVSLSSDAASYYIYLNLFVELIKVSPVDPD